MERYCTRITETDELPLGRDRFNLFVDHRVLFTDFDEIRFLQDQKTNTGRSADIGGTGNGIKQTQLAENVTLK